MSQGMCPGCGLVARDTVVRSHTVGCDAYADKWRAGDPATRRDVTEVFAEHREAQAEQSAVDAKMAAYRQRAEHRQAMQQARWKEPEKVAQIQAQAPGWQPGTGYSGW